MAYVINDDCVACGTCIDVCPSGAISEGEKYSINSNVCIECGTCADVCPSGAILEQVINNSNTNNSSKSKTNMVNSINLSMIRGLCDELGLRSSIASNGDILIIFDADEDFGHNVCFFLKVVEQSVLYIYGVADFTVKQHNVGKVLLRLNEFNCTSGYLKAYLDKSGQIYVERGELLDKGVSEEFIKQTIGLSVSFTLDFFKENFSDF